LLTLAGVVKRSPRRQLSGASGWMPEDHGVFEVIALQDPFERRDVIRRCSRSIEQQDRRCACFTRRERRCDKDKHCRNEQSQ
jgi:hypothetical protein